MMTTLPIVVNKKMSEWFDFPQTEIDCQVATCLDNHPHIRTMKLYDVNEEGMFVLITATTTPKWNDLMHAPRIALCLLNLNHGQMVIEGSVTLGTQQNHQQTIQSYWKELPEFWKEIYRMHEKHSKTDIPNLFGVIFVKPEKCEILEICKEDYMKSKRTQFTLINNQWLEKSLMPI